MDQPTVATSNFSSSPGLPPHPSWYSRGLVPAVMMSFLFLLGAPGNIAVIIIRPNRQRMSSLTQSLLLNLAISDLSCLLTLPPVIYALLHGWTLGLVICKLLIYLLSCSIYGSRLIVAGLSLQRYLVVVHHKMFQEGQKQLILVLLWLVAFVLSIPCLVVRGVKASPHWPECEDQFSSDAQLAAVRFTETVLGFVTFSVVAFSYIHLKKTINQAAFYNNPQTSRLVSSIIVSFFILWAPYLTISVLNVMAICLKTESLMKFCKYSLRIVRVVIFINSGLNPFLYAFTSNRFCRKKPMPRNPDNPTAAEL